MAAEAVAEASSAPVIRLRRVTKVYRMGAGGVPALQGVDLDIHRGEMVAIMGPSGSGKSTLMNILGCLDRPTSGSYWLAGRDVSALDDDALAKVRNETIGFVFQSFNLLPQLTAWQNVELPLVYRGVPRSSRRAMALRALAQVGLEARAHHLPARLSGGQQQRVAVARALVGHPELVLADEPTGNLDSHAGREIMALFQQLNAEGATLVIVTHDEQIGRHCRRIVRIFDGRIVDDQPVRDRLLATPSEAAAGGG